MTANIMLLYQKVDEISFSYQDDVEIPRLFQLLLYAWNCGFGL